MTRREFVSRVTAVLNESDVTGIESSLLLGAETSQLEKYIHDAFAGGWLLLANMAPVEWLPKKNGNMTPHPVLIPPVDIEPGANNLTDGTGYVELSDDFFRLSAFRLRGWKRAVFDAEREDGRVWSVQGNKYTRGSAMRPVCVICRDGKMRYFSLPHGSRASEHIVEEYSYVPVIRSVEDGMIYVDDDTDLLADVRIVEPLCYAVAANVLALRGRADMASALEERAKGMIPMPGLKQGMDKSI